jgi:hypothetical protein
MKATPPHLPLLLLLLLSTFSLTLSVPHTRSKAPPKGPHDPPSPPPSPPSHYSTPKRGGGPTPLKRRDREPGGPELYFQGDGDLEGHPSFFPPEGSNATFEFYTPIFKKWKLASHGWKGLGERGLDHLAKALSPKASSGLGRGKGGHRLFKHPPKHGCMLLSPYQARKLEGLAYLKSLKPPYLKMKVGSLQVGGARGRRKWVWMGAHEFVAWACHGPAIVEEGVPRSVVCHKCHKSLCLHPRHLEHGSDRKNVKMTKGRLSRARGGGGKFVAKGP